MINKFSVIILCIALLFSLVACNENSTGNSTSTESSGFDEITSNTDKNNSETKSVFNTENITNITFYAYYGNGKGSEVQNEDIPEITSWLSSFIVGEKVSDLLAPGTNTYYVEIEYSDGSIIKNGLDTVEIDGTVYYLKKDKQPSCFTEKIFEIK